MQSSSITFERPQTRGEEIANSLTHGLGLLAALVAAPFLIGTAAGNGDVADIVGASVFALTMIFVYTTSTVYHSMPFGRTKHVLRVIDHGAIFLLIAGTYTPFTLGVFQGGWGITLLVLEWTLALTGITLKTLTGVRYRRLSILLYLIMGWLVVIAVEPLIQNMPIDGILWILAGGIAYTAGIPFYVAKKIKYTHFVWHLFVLTGTSCHFVAVLWYSG